MSAGVFESLGAAALHDIIAQYGAESRVGLAARTALHWFDRAGIIAAERDDAQARVRELAARASTATIRDVHKALGAASGESVVTRAEAVMAQIDDARAILGARPDELLADAAARVMVDLGDAVLAEADPNPPIPVHHTYAGDSGEVVIRITSRDPALLALPFGARLGLVRLS